MTRYRVLTALCAMACAATSAPAQTKIDLGAQTRDVNFSGAASVIPFPTGASLPATCVRGQMFFNTAAPAGQNSYQCVAANTWAPLGSGSAGAVTPLAVRQNSPTELSLGSNCSLTAPCEYRIGSVVTQMGAPATLDISGGNGLVYIYVDASGTLTAGGPASQGPTMTCTGCQALTGITQFPTGSIPLVTWNVTNGTFDATGTDNRSILSAAPAIAAGSNVAITQTGGSVTISAVDASGLSGGSGSSGGSSGGSGATVAGTGSELQYNNYGSLGAVTGSSVSGSTILLGGATPASASQSVLGIGNAIVNGNPNGTLLGINSPSGFSGDLVNLMSANTPVFEVDRYGEVLFNGGFLSSGQIRLAASGYGTSLWANYGGAPGSSTRLAILSSDPTSQIQIGTGFAKNAFVMNGLGKVGIGSNAPPPANTAAGADLLIQNATATTGNTLVQVEAGAGQSGDLMQWLSAGGTAGAGVSSQGALWNLPFGTQPACGASTRGMLWHAQGGTGVKDTVAICAKDATDAYGWRTIF